VPINTTNNIVAQPTNVCGDTTQIAISNTMIAISNCTRFVDNDDDIVRILLIVSIEKRLFYVFYNRYLILSATRKTNRVD
jgi:hypothetical protein